MRYILNEDTVDKFVDYAINVWHLPAQDDRFALANAAIDATEQFFIDMNLPMHLSDLAIDDTYFKDMAAHAVSDGDLKNAYVPLNEDDVINILKACL